MQPDTATRHQLYPPHRLICSQSCLSVCRTVWEGLEGIDLSEDVWCGVQEAGFQVLGSCLHPQYTHSALGYEYEFSAASPGPFLCCCAPHHDNKGPLSKINPSSIHCLCPGFITTIEILTQWFSTFLTL